MKFVMILYVAIYNLSIYQLLGEWLAELPAILDSFLLVQPIPLLQGRGRWLVTKWWAKSISSLKTAKRIHWYHFYKTAKSMAKCIRQLCGELQLAGCLTRRYGTI